MAKAKTPEERSEILRQTEKKARRRYRKTSKRKQMNAEEIQFAKDIIVPLKVVGGYSNLQIGMIVGISKGQVAQLLKDENLQRRISKLKSDLPQAALDLMQVYLIEAVQAVVHVLRTSENNAEILQAAAMMFDRAGLPKLSRSEQSSEFKDPPSIDNNDLFQQLREASPEIQEKAAQLRDFFEDGLRTLMSDGKAEADGPTGTDTEKT